MEDAGGDGRAPTCEMEQRLHETVSDLREEIKGLSDARAKLCSRTAAEIGLERAFHDYDRKDEAAWR